MKHGPQFLTYTGTVDFTANVPFDLGEMLGEWVGSLDNDDTLGEPKDFQGFFEWLDQECAANMVHYMELDGFPDVDFNYAQEDFYKAQYEAFIEAWREYRPECKGQRDIFGNEV